MEKRYLKKLKEDKKGLELRFWVVALILFSGIFALLVVAFHDAASGYDVQNITDAGIEERYNRLSQQESLVESLQETTSGEEGFKLFNALGTIFTATVGVLNLVLASITFIPDVVATFASDFGIPLEVSNLFFTIVALVITTLIIFAIVNSIRR